MVLCCAVLCGMGLKEREEAAVSNCSTGEGEEKEGEMSGGGYGCKKKYPQATEKVQTSYNSKHIPANNCSFRQFTPFLADL